MPLKDGLNISSNDCDLSQTKFTNKTIVNTHERNSVKTNKAKGKLNTLDEFNEQIKGDEEINEKDKISEFSENKVSLDKLTQLFMEHKEDIFRQNNQLYDEIKNTLVKPEN